MILALTRGREALLTRISQLNCKFPPFIFKKIYTVRNFLIHFLEQKVYLKSVRTVYIDARCSKGQAHQPPNWGHLHLKITLISRKKLLKNRNLSKIASSGPPFIDILQDRRYWVIHLITIPYLFLPKIALILTKIPNFRPSGALISQFLCTNCSGYLILGQKSPFGGLHLVGNSSLFSNQGHISSEISLISDRFSRLNEIEDVK